MQVLLVQYIIAHFPVMEQHLGIGSCNKTDLRLLYFRTDSMDKSVKIPFIYIMIIVTFHINKSCSDKDNFNNDNL